MKNSFQLTLCALVIMCTSVVNAGERVGDFALIDHQGAFHHMTWYDDQNAVVIMPLANDSVEYLPDFQALQAKYQEQGVVFFLMNPGLTTSRSEVQAAALAQNINLPILMDDTQLVTEMLGITRLGEVVVYAPGSFEVLYRGPIVDQLEQSLEQVIDGNRGDLVALASTGAAIEFPAAEAHQSLSYENDIAPIIAENCASCHREGGIAPFAMDSNLAVQGWSPMIREVVLTKRMPPGQIDNKVGHKIKNEMNLSDSDMQKLVHWVNAGSPVESDNDPLTELIWPESKWSLGEPDLIVQIEPQTIPATGTVDYMDIPIDLGLDRDVWIKGSQVAPGDPSVVHHVITTVVPPEGAPNCQQILMNVLAGLPEDRAQAIRSQLFAAMASGEQPNIAAILGQIPEIDISAFIGGSSNPNMASIAGYAPGNDISLNPEGVGGLLKAGSTLSLQMHYTTSGKESVDATEIGIYFYEEGVVPRERMSGGVGNTFALDIPSQAKDHELELTTTVRQDAEIFSLMPHMHFRGKRMKFTAVYPDGSEELIVSVPAYSFNWQLAHELEEPMFVPAGTKIVAVGAFDNSSQNAFNPDPSIEVKWGEQSWEEMFMGFYSWKNINQGSSD